MPESDSFLPPPPQPTPARPLLGLTVLMVEDSRYASEAVRLLCLRSGARIRRADTLRAAGRHLSVYRPSVVIVDMGLPDGSGADLLSELTQATPRIDVLLGTSGDADGAERALAAGADAFLPKPISSLAAFQSAVIAHLPPERRPDGLRVLPEDTVRPDPITFEDDMVAASSELEEVLSDRRLDYVTRFVRGVAHSADDADLVSAADALSRARAEGRAADQARRHMADMVRARLRRRRAV